jgi:hypothetical protein
MLLLPAYCWLLLLLTRNPVLSSLILSYILSYLDQNLIQFIPILTAAAAGGC